MITVNGQPCEQLSDDSLEALIEHLGFKDQLLAVEINKTLIPYKQRSETAVKDGDAIEIVSLVGGG